MEPKIYHTHLSPDGAIHTYPYTLQDPFQRWSSIYTYVSQIESSKYASR
jgi:hypothetical protein